MVKEYIDTVLKLCSLGLIIAAAGLWAASNSRPKFRDEQTLIGGTIWSQLIIPFGLLLSNIVEERLDSFVHGYFLLTGVGLCVTTGIVLIVDEIKAMKAPPLSVGTQMNFSFLDNPYYDRVYLGIGILSSLAGVLTFTEFLILVL